MARNYLNNVDPHNSYGDVIREARKKRGFTLEQAAELINVTQRAFGGWERNEDTPSPLHRQALVECLGIDPELIGAERQHDFSPQEASEYGKRTTSYLNRAMFNSALTSSNFLVHNLRRQVNHKRGDEALIEPLIHALALAGHAASIARNDPSLALRYYKQMEEYALNMKEAVPEKRQTFLSLARTYQAEMLRREDTGADY